MISKDKVKDFLKIARTENEENVFLDDLIAYAGAFIDSYCNQHIEAASKTIKTKGNGSEVLYLMYSPVNSLSSVEYRTAPDETYATVSGDTDLYDEDNLYYIYYPDGFVSTYQYQLTFNSGYSTVPDIIQKVCLEMVAVMYRASKEETTGVSSKQKNQNAVTNTTAYLDMTPQWRADLSKYRIPTV